MRRPTEDLAFTAFLAYDHGVAVGEGWYAGFLRANVDQASVTPRVLPSSRRSRAARWSAASAASAAGTGSATG